MPGKTSKKPPKVIKKAAIRRVAAKPVRPQVLTSDAQVTGERQQP
jgi:hypothetical protein